MHAVTSLAALLSFRHRLLLRDGHTDHLTSGLRRCLMLELNHIIRGEDLLSGSVAPAARPQTIGSPTVFDLKAGGLFKLDANTDRAQLEELRIWNSSSH
jgi:hypothetical protein